MIAYSHTFKLLSKSTKELTITLPKNEVQNEYRKSFQALSAELTVAGFRKGKAPKDIAQKHIQKESVYKQLIQSTIPQIYADIVNKESLKPIANPKIELVKAQDQEDWIIRITVAEKPTIDLSKYKELVKKSIRKAEIWVPGKEKKAEESAEAKSQKRLNEILELLLKEIKIEVSEIVIDEELNKRLARLLDDVQKIGLTVDAYLKSKQTTIDQMKAGYRKEIEDAYKIEFLLMEIADKEGIKVEKDDLEKLFSAIKDEKERKEAQANSYFYASLLRKQKTLDFLLAL